MVANLNKVFFMTGRFMVNRRNSKLLKSLFGDKFYYIFYKDIF